MLVQLQKLLKTQANKTVAFATEDIHVTVCIRERHKTVSQKVS